MGLYKYNNQEESIKEYITETLATKTYYARKNGEYFEIVFLCIGTDKITGDCFGPLVGSKLQELLEEFNVFNISIYGSLIENVNYSNVEKIICNIKRNHVKPYIVVIDAALSKKENIGKIYINEGKTTLGKGLNKNKIEIGNLSIKAVVGKDYRLPKYNFNVLQNISLNIVMKLATIVAEAITEFIIYS